MLGYELKEGEDSAKKFYILSQFVCGREHGLKIYYLKSNPNVVSLVIFTHGKQDDQITSDRIAKVYPPGVQNQFVKAIRAFKGFSEGFDYFSRILADVEKAEEQHAAREQAREAREATKVREAEEFLERKAIERESKEADKKYKKDKAAAKAYIERQEQKLRNSLQHTRYTDPHDNFKPDHNSQAEHYERKVADSKKEYDETYHPKNECRIS